MRFRGSHASSRHFSRSGRSEKIISIVYLPTLNPHCDSGNILEARLCRHDRVTHPSICLLQCNNKYNKYNLYLTTVVQIGLKFITTFTVIKWVSFSGVKEVRLGMFDPLLFSSDADGITMFPNKSFQWPGAQIKLQYPLVCLNDCGSVCQPVGQSVSQSVSQSNWCINCVLMRVMEGRERDNS